MAYELHGFFRTNPLLGTLNQRITRGLCVFFMIMLVAEVPTGLAFQESEIPLHPYGGTLRLASYGKPAPLDPFNVTDTISSALMDLVFSRLIKHISQDQFEPNLAERWEISEDGLVYTFYLRKDIRFHDGVALTSKDVLFSFQRFSDPKISPTFSRNFEIIQKWEAPDRHIFKIHLNKPQDNFLLTLWKVYILPQHRLQRMPEDLPRLIQHPLGTGPFRFDGQDTSKMKFVAFENYFEGRAYLDAIVVKFIEKDMVWQAFLRGEIDIVFYLDRENYLEIKEDPAFQIFRVLANYEYTLIFNFENQLMQEKPIREALSYAVNRSELINRLEGGGGVSGNGPFHPDFQAYPREVKPVSYDPEKALGLLEAAGFVRQGDWLERNGQKLSVNILLDEKNVLLGRMAKLIRQQWQEIGVQAQLSFYSNYPELSQKVYNSSDFQTFLFTFHAGPSPAFALGYWHSKADEIYNVGHYQNLSLDAFIEDARKTRKPAERIQDYRNGERLIAEDKAALFFYFPYQYHAVSGAFHFPEKLFPMTSFQSLKDVYQYQNKGEEVK